MREDLSITVNGLPLSFIGSWGEAVGTWRRRGGSWELTWRMYLPLNYRHPALVRGALVVAKVGATTIWRGEISEVDWDEQTFIAAGLCRQAEDALAFGFGTRTSNPREAVSWGILRGILDWSSLSNIPNVPLTPNAENGTPNYVADLLDAWAAQDGIEWWINKGGVPFVNFGAAPTTPRWTVTAGAGVLGLADEEYVTDLHAVYAPKPGKVATAYVYDHSQAVGRVERVIDLAGLGFITATKALTIATSILKKFTARTGFSDSVQVAHGQVLTMGGTPAALSHVAAHPNQMVRLLGLFDERGAAASTDVVVDETVLDFEAELLTIKPVGLADRNFASIVESMGGTLL